MTPPPSATTPPHPSLSGPLIPNWLLRLYRHPVLFLTTILIIPLTVIGLWLTVVNERQWRSREANDLLVAARLAARILQEELAQTLDAQHALVSHPAFREAVRRREGAALLPNLQVLTEAMPMVDRASVRDARGHLIASVPARGAEDESALPLDSSEDDVSVASLAVSGVSLRSRASGEKVITISSPIHPPSPDIQTLGAEEDNARAASERRRAGDAVIGTLQMQYRMSAVSRWVEKIRLESSGFLYVADQHGFLVAYPFQILPGHPKNVSAWPPVGEDASANGRLMRFAQGRPARRWTAAIVALEPFGWRVVAQQPDAMMLKPFYELVGSFAGLLVVPLLLVSMLVWRWAHVHGATLELLAQQAHLLRLSEQHRTEDRLRRQSKDHADG